MADPATGERVEKAVFVVFFAGERARQKILKICEVGAGGCERLRLERSGAEVHLIAAACCNLPCGSDGLSFAGCSAACHRCTSTKTSLAAPHPLQAFSANRYPFPDDLSRQRQMNAEVGAGGSAQFGGRWLRRRGVPCDCDAPAVSAAMAAGYVQAGTCMT